MSGRSARARSTASIPSAAVATISTSSIRPSSIASPSRTTGWSSAIRTRIVIAGTSISTRQPSAVGPADIVPPARSIRSRSPRSPRPPPIPCARRSGRDAVVDRQRGAVGFVAHRDRRARARRVPRDVRQRLLRAAVEREARIGRQRPRLAFDPQRDVEVHVGLVALDQRRKLGDRRQRVAAQRADGLAGVGESGLDELAGAVDRVAQTRAGVFAVGELARPLQLDRGAGERVREHVVQLARDPAALGDRRRAGLLIARVLELGQQQLGLVLALARPLEELRDDPEQHRHQHLGRDGRGGAPGDRRDGTERDGHRASRSRRRP